VIGPEAFPDGLFADPAIYVEPPLEGVSIGARLDQEYLFYGGLGGTSDVAETRALDRDRSPAKHAERLFPCLLLHDLSCRFP